ncbi:MAG: hypothetical protein ACLGGX_12535 [Bdellovibrionia bacterium]
MKKLILGISILFALVPTAVLAQSGPFLAAVVEVEGSIQVWINPKSFWLKNGHLTDSYSEEEAELIEDMVDAANLCNLMESTYEPCRSGTSVKSVKQRLLEVGFILDTDFQDWAEQEASIF